MILQCKDLTTKDPVKLRREVVMLYQTPLAFEGTIEENLQMELKISEKQLATDEEMKTILKDMELNKYIQEPINKLSVGKHQRIAIVRVSLMTQNVYILD